MNDKLKQFSIDLLAILITFAAGYYIGGKMNRETTITSRTVEIFVPGYTDATPKPVEAKKNPSIKKDSSDYWRKRNDSLQAIITGRDTTASADTARSEYIYPYQIVIPDSLTTNFVTVFPLNPLSTRARIDSTHYKPIRLNYTYLDTTVNVIHANSFRTYATVGGGAVLGAAIANIPGAGVGAIIGLIIDEMF